MERIPDQGRSDTDGYHKEAPVSDELEEIEAGKAAFMSLLAALDPEVTAVIPTRATQDNFLISLSKAGKRTFVTLAEDDLIDLDGEADIIAEVRKHLQEALESLGS